MKKVLLAASVVMSLSLVTGCAQQGLTGQTYSRNEARQVQSVQFGRLESVTPVIIEGNQNGLIGTGGGALIGGLLGNQIGGGSGKKLATVVGALAGGVAGNHAEASLTRVQGQELTVRLDSGRIISVVQAVDNGQFMDAGARVRVLGQGRTLRVTY